MRIIGKVLASIAKIKGIAPGDIGLDSTFEELKMDSLDGLDLFFELEEAFDLTISDERARSLRTVRNIVEEIEKLLSDRNAELFRFKTDGGCRAKASSGDHRTWSYLLAGSQQRSILEYVVTRSLRNRVD